MTKKKKTKPKKKRLEFIITVDDMSGPQVFQSEEEVYEYLETIYLKCTPVEIYYARQFTPKKKILV